MLGQIDQSTETDGHASIYGDKGRTRPLRVQEWAMRARTFAMSIGLIGVLLAAPTVAAGSVATIRIDVTFGGAETFTTTGRLLCPSGSAVSDPQFVAGFGAKGRGVHTFHSVKTLTCADGSGTWKLLVDSAANRTSAGTVGGFAAGHGTLDYAGLHGGGSLRGTAKPDGSGLVEIYTGMLTIAP
jgi:hypothetical protein